MDSNSKVYVAGHRGLLGCSLVKRLKAIVIRKMKYR